MSNSPRAIADIEQEIGVMFATELIRSVLKAARKIPPHDPRRLKKVCRRVGLSYEDRSERAQVAISLLNLYVNGQLPIRPSRSNACEADLNECPFSALIEAVASGRVALVGPSQPGNALPYAMLIRNYGKPSRVSLSPDLPDSRLAAFLKGGA